jgi:epoxyqueuosine reductase
MQASQATASEQQPGPGSWVDLHWLLSASDEELLSQVGRWYIPAREPRYVRRNALVVLGNAQQPINSDLRLLLADYLDHPDDLLVGHATWAAIRLGLVELLDEPTRAARPAILLERANCDAKKQRIVISVRPELGD